MVKSERALIRKRAGLTQLTLARLTDMSQSRISSWENGDRELAIYEVEKIAKVIREHLEDGPQYGCLGDLVQALVPSILQVGDSTRGCPSKVPNDH